MVMEEKHTLRDMLLKWARTHGGGQRVLRGGLGVALRRIRPAAYMVSISREGQYPSDAECEVFDKLIHRIFGDHTILRQSHVDEIRRSDGSVFYVYRWLWMNRPARVLDVKIAEQIALFD